MSAHPFLLNGWDELSVWGLDGDHYYAQLTPNGIDDADGPRVWIAPPAYAIGRVAELVRIVAAGLDLPPAVVDQAMARGLAMSRGEPVVPVTISEVAPPLSASRRQAPTGEGPAR